jgi:hypothetical protein
MYSIINIHRTRSRRSVLDSFKIHFLAYHVGNLNVSIMITQERLNEVTLAATTLGMQQR